MRRSCEARALKRVAKVLSLLAVIVAVVWAICYGVAMRRHAQATKAWTDSFGSWEDYVAEYPGRSANPAALRLEALAAAVGVDLAPWGLKGRARPTAEAHARLVRAGSMLDAVIDGHLRRTQATPVEIPEAITEYLRENESALDALRVELMTGDLPLWEGKVGDGRMRPNLLGHFYLQRLFVADALVRTDEGDHAGARIRLEASFRLNESLLDCAPATCQDTALGVARLQVGALRHLGESHDWSERLAAYGGFRSSMIRSLVARGAGVLELDPAKALSFKPENAIFSQVAKPYASFCIADFLDRFRTVLERLDPNDDNCLPVTDGRLAMTFESIPQWNELGGDLYPDIASSLDSVSRFQLDLELTEKVLELKAACERDGVWPAAAEGIETSRCPGAHWVYDVGNDGSMSIAFSQKVEWPGGARTVLPTEYSARDRAGGTGSEL